MREGGPYSDRERADVGTMRALAERTFDVVAPRGLMAAVAHVLYAAATELDNGRALPIEIRRAANHLVRELQQALDA